MNIEMVCPGVAAMPEPELVAWWRDAPCRLTGALLAEVSGVCERCALDCESRAWAVDAVLPAQGWLFPPPARVPPPRLRAARRSRAPLAVQYPLPFVVALDPERIVEGLPGFVQELAQDIGLQAAAELIRWCGGRHVHIPTHPDADSVLRDKLKPQTLSWLSEQFGGTVIYVPTRKALTRAERNESIRVALANKMTPQQVARQHRISERQVFRIATR